MGIGPRGMREGDRCAVLFGARVPYVLRRREEGGLYTLIGEAYMQDVMGGEVVVDTQKKGGGEGEVCLLGLR